MKKSRLALLVFLLVVGGALAQRRRGGGGGGWGGGEHWYPEYDTCRTARECPSHSTGTANWTNAPGFEKNVFSFARIRRDRDPYGSPSAGHWWTDFPDS